MIAIPTLSLPSKNSFVSSVRPNSLTSKTAWYWLKGDGTGIFKSAGSASIKKKQIKPKT